MSSLRQYRGDHSGKMGREQRRAGERAGGGTNSVKALLGASLVCLMEIKEVVKAEERGVGDEVGEVARGMMILGGMGNHWKVLN